MKILYCIPTLETGGAERQLCNVALELRRMGDEIHVACGRGGAFRERLTSGGMFVHDVGGRGHHDPRLLFNLVRLMRRLKPDVVETCLTQMDVAGGAAALLTRTPWVLRESSAAPSYPPGWKSSLRRMLGRRAGAIVSNSRQGDAYWSAAGARRRDIVRNGIPFAEIDAIPDGRTNRKTVLFAGRMDDGKNAGTVVDALSRIADVDFLAVFCGDGPQRPELERIAGARVIFPGYVMNLWERMKRADVFVSLSRYEGSPNAVLEAMACGCPLVVSDIDAHREVLDEESALFVSSDDAAGAAEAIRTTLVSPRDAEARARAARVKAEQWTVEAMARGHKKVYESVRSHA